MSRSHILITGAASGIGAATASLLARTQDTKLLLIDQDKSGLQTIAAELGDDACTAVAMDVSQSDAWGNLDLNDVTFSGAVISAGLSDASLIADMSFEAWRRVLSVNLDGAFLTLQTVVRHASDGASIVAVSSATGHKAAQMTGAYGASKAALSQLVKVAALEGAERGIRVNAVAPGGVKTPMFSSQPFFESFSQEHGGADGAWAALAEATPLKRFAEPEEVAQLISLLLGPQTNTMTGTILNCDGGYGL